MGIKFKARLLVAAGAAVGCIAGSAVGSSPTPPVIPSAPLLPSFQEQTSVPYVTGTVTSSISGPAVSNVTQVPAQFGTGGYSTIKNIFAVTVPPSTPTSPGYLFPGYTAYELISGPDSVMTGEISTSSYSQVASGRFLLGRWTYTVSPVTISTLGSATLGALVETSQNDPMEITQTITVADGSANFATGSYGYNNGTGPASSSYSRGIFSVGSGGYAWVKIDSGGTLDTEGTFANGQLGGTYVGSAISIFRNIASPTGTSSAGDTFLNLGGPSTGYGIVNVAGGTWNASNSPLFVGFAGGIGFITVNDGTINLTNTSLLIGESGTGTIVMKGGNLTSTGSGGYVIVGAGAGVTPSTNSLFVTSGASANISSALVVGDGTSGVLTIETAGVVHSSSGYAGGSTPHINGSLNQNFTGGNGNIIIDGASSTWDISNKADFGVSGTASITVQNSGNLDIGGTTTLGDQATGNGTLLAQAQGTVESGNATLGNQAGATGNATVTGLNSSWTVDGDLTIGDYGTGSLFLNNNAMLTTTGDATLGSQAASTGAATVSDAGTEWQINGELKVGDNGSATMLVENGSYISLAGNLAIADSGGTSTLTLDGNGSRMIANGTSVTIGGQGDGTLTVQNAADAIFSGASVSLGEKTTGTGTLTVQGSNTIMSAGSLTVGGYGTGTLNVQDSASLSTGTNISLGEQASGTGTATIDNAAVSDAGTLTVGGYGTGTLTIQDGGSLTVQGNDVTLGEQNTGSGTLNLSGTSSTLNFNGDMTIGKSGSGTFAVSGGADFNGSAMTLASGSGFGGASTGGTGELDINGASSVLLSQDLTIGKYGVGTLAMTSGAVLANKGDATLGSQPATEGSATLSSDSNWTVGGSLTDGSQGTGSITVQGGSSLITNGASLTVGKQGEGSLTVTGPKSSVQYAGDLVIGKQSAGTFNIDAGAVTKPTSQGTGEVYIAETSGINGTLNIDGSGSSLSGTDMVVGGTGSTAGGTGLVSLTNGGQINLTGKLAMWKDGTINATGGAITLGTAGSTSPANGNVYINSQGELSGTGTITGNVTNSGGTLNIGGTQPGNLDIIGNFTQSSGTFKVAIGGTGTGQASQLDATGNVSITGGTVEFDFVNHYAPQKGQTFQFIDPPQSVSVNNVSYTFTGLAPGFDFSVTPDTNGLLFTALNNGVATPEPASLALLALGGSLLLLRRRKKKSA